MSKTALIYGVGAGLFAVGLAVLLLSGGAVERHRVLQFEPITAEEFSNKSHVIVPIMLQKVYEAFGETEENAIYDRLSEVAANEALESLYLERVGAMKGGGLPDQEIHELELLKLTSRWTSSGVDVSARWRVLGLVGHAEHLHMRGNAYAADLEVTAVPGGWRVTGFTLTDVDRTDAGTLQEKEGHTGTPAPSAVETAVQQ